MYRVHLSATLTKRPSSPVVYPKDVHSKRDIYVQKIKVQKLMFRFIPRSLKKITMHLYHLDIIRKASYSR